MRQFVITTQVTKREEPTLDIYLREVARIKLITPDEEAELARKIHNGDSKAFEILVNSNLRFVIAVAKHYQGQGLSLPDLINEGNLGLINAARMFDETRGFRFITYAVWWIRQSILRALGEYARIVRLPLNQLSSRGQIIKAFTKIEQEYQREPTLPEIVEMINLHPLVVNVALNPSNFQVSIDSFSNDNEGAEYNPFDALLINDTPAPDNFSIGDSLKLNIERILGSLTNRQAEIIRYFFGLNGFSAHSLREISVKLNISHERARQIKMKALMKLHRNHGKFLLDTYNA